VPETPRVPEFAGFDHIDVRVRSLAEVESFYDALMPLLGLPRKSYALVGSDGEWTDLPRPGGHNAIEYFEALVTGRAAHFIGFIEDPEHRPQATRIAFRDAAPFEAAPWLERLRALGARVVEPSDDLVGYPAVFFEDPAGTKLEICARLPASA
jgi:catechol 2,3-dioxygenase-like lactoylglutathione lyase family enzyme